MRALLAVVPLSIFAFVVMLSIGTACGTGYRERGSFGGCRDEVVRQWGVLAGSGAGASSSSASAAGDAGRTGSLSTSGRAVTAGGSAASAPAAWRQVSYWAGRGNRETEAFVIVRPEWRLVWSAKSGATGGAGTLRVSVLDSADPSASLVVDADGPGNDTTPLSRGPGRYRLRIESTDVEWYVQVEQN